MNLKLTLMNRLDAEERELMQQIQTYEACTMAVLNMASDQIRPLHKFAVPSDSRNTQQERAA
ncbi:hypothetical protein [Paenibacillus elgii]|uniref:hypothetical protein n=1 Tax=Paenibacillus elgii TaxID=189691 RepID=UPI0013D144D0|nr:hypothetical protein [Paenibacillus elgii]NEN87134.1 hypothetical protein [Paenibacillus elgii]